MIKEFLPLRKVEIGEKKEKFNSRIFLAFFRHGEKPSEEEEAADINITAKSRQEALQKAKTYPSRDVDSIKQAVAFGGKALRTQETAGLVMGGIEREITGEESLDELKQKIDSGLKIGTKLAIQNELQFEFSKDSPTDQALVEATRRGKWMKFILEKSDEMAVLLGDKKAITYARISGQIAKIILKYVDIEKNWDRIVQKDENKYYKPTLERYFGCHAAIGAFLAKVIEKTQGLGERDIFANSLEKGYLDYLEGFTVEIVNPAGGNAEEPEIVIEYQSKNGKYNFKEKVEKRMLKKFIDDWRDFESNVDKNIK